MWYCFIIPAWLYEYIAIEINFGGRVKCIRPQEIHRFEPLQYGILEPLDKKSRECVTMLLNRIMIVLCVGKLG